MGALSPERDSRLMRLPYISIRLRAKQDFFCFKTKEDWSAFYSQPQETNQVLCQEFYSMLHKTTQIRKIML